MKNDELIAQTPFGEIAVGIKSDPDYPGIFVELRGEHLNDRFKEGAVRLAWVEYSSDKQCLQTIVYGDGDADDFTHLIEHEHIRKSPPAVKTTDRGRPMDREYLAKLCDARDTICSFCEVNECEKCIVTHLIDDAHNELPDDEGSFTAFVYEDDGIVSHDMATYYSKDEAIQFAEARGWDEVVNDNTGEVVWRQTK